MKVKVAQELKDYNDEPLNQNGEPIVLGTVLINALNYTGNDSNPTAEEKMRAYDLSVQISQNKEVDLKSEDVVFIKERLSKMYSPLVYGQVVNILEG